MRFPTKVVLLVLLPVAACHDAAAPEGIQLGFSALASAATRTSGTVVLTGEGTSFIDCVNEELSFHASVAMKYNSITTSSGNTVFSDHFVPGSATGTAVGLTSGTVWTLKRDISPEVITVQAGSTAFFTQSILWTSETGSSFTLHHNFEFVQNANGEVTVNRFESRCDTR
jgi:hypothetical protein